MKRVTLKALADLLKEDGHCLVGIIGNSLKITREYASRPVMVDITYINGKFSLSFPNYLFRSKISHFAPTTKEMRYCCNKAVIFSLIRLLKRSRVWNYVDNKDFIQVNDKNEGSNKKALSKALDNLLGEEY